MNRCQDSSCGNLDFLHIFQIHLCAPTLHTTKPHFTPANILKTTHLNILEWGIKSYKTQFFNDFKQIVTLFHTNEF